MATHTLGIIMYGVTGRMGTNQHLVRSILEIRKQGGVALANGDRVMPDPILVGRNAEKVEALARAHGIERWTTDLDARTGRSATTPSSSTRPPRRCGRHFSRMPSPPASTCTARSRSPTISTRRSTSRGRRAGAA